MRPLFLRNTRTPTLLQMEAVECGAAALGIILAHYGRWEPLESLRVACGVSRDGSKAANVLKAARAFGLEADGYKLDNPDELGSLGFPLVVFWKFNHFLVVESVGRRRVRLNDPGTGPRWVTREEFDRSFTGIALTFQPTETFQPGGTRPSVANGLKRRMKPVKDALWLALLISLALVVPGILVPSFSQIFIDRYLIGHFQSWLAPLLIGVVATSLIQAGLTWLQREQMLKLETKLSATAAARMTVHMLRLPIAFFGQRHAGDLVARSSLADRLASLLTGDLGNAVMSLFTMAFFAVIMLQYDVVLTGIGVLFAVLDIALLTVMTRRLADRNQALAAENGRLSGIVTQGLQILDDYRANGTEGVFLNSILSVHARTLNITEGLVSGRLLVTTVPVTLATFATAAVLGIGGIRVMEGQLTIGMLVAFQSLMGSFLGPVGQLVGLGVQVQDAQASIRRVDDVMAHPLAPEFAIRTEPLPASSRRSLSGSVRLENVTFGYSPLEKPLIEDFSLDVAPGSWVALVGGSGSGKSTVAKLVSGLYRPWTGRILLDGVPFDDLPRELVRDNVAVVDQEITLFEGSVRDNLAMWDPTLPEERVAEAARDADIHDYLVSRPGGYAARLTENGRNLSGGQRARLEIARALALRPAVLVLDEATSALDPLAEENVMRNLRRRGLTCIIVAHRLSTVRDCDEIIVLEHGRPVERGTHAELIAARGAYRQLVEA